MKQNLPSAEISSGVVFFSFLLPIISEQVALKKKRKKTLTNNYTSRYRDKILFSVGSPDVVLASESKYVKQVKSFLLLSKCFEGWASEKMR